MLKLNLKQFAICCPLSMLLIQTAAADINRLTIANASPQFIQQKQLIGPINPNSDITFSVWLKLRNKAQMDQLSHDIYDKNSPRYHHFMTKAEYIKSFAPLTQTKQMVQQYFIANGMNAEIAYDAVRVTASVKQVEKVFAVKMNNYINQHYFANATPPSMDAFIGQYVRNITGLTNIPRFHNFNVEAAVEPPQAIHNLKFLWHSFTPMAQPTTTSLSGFTASTLRTAYHVANVAPVKGTTIDGTGQTIVITDSPGLSPATVIADANIYGAGTLPPLTANNFMAIDTNGNLCTTQCNGTGNGIETGLDVESAHTLAPGARIVLVIGDVDDGLTTAIETLVYNNYTLAGFTNAYQITNSWGGTEFSDAALEPILQLAMMSGITVDFSSGDCGDGSVNTSKCSGDPVPSTAYPAVSTYATAIGGTAIFVDENWNYAFETVWGDYNNHTSNFFGGSTGGISRFYGPASWQDSIKSFTAVGYSGTVGSHNKRAVPDIAMLADPQTGLRIVVDGEVLQDGGTSLASPLFTAVIALTNQARALSAGGQNPIGQAAPALYNNQIALANNGGLNVIIPPHQFIRGATQATAPGAPAYAFTIRSFTYGWDTSLGFVDTQFWNDTVGLGSVNVPNFVALMAGL